MRSSGIVLHSRRKHRHTENVLHDLHFGERLERLVETIYETVEEFESVMLLTQVHWFAPQSAIVRASFKHLLLPTLNVDSER